MINRKLGSRVRWSCLGLFLLHAATAGAQTVCPSGVIGAPSGACIFIQDQITGASATLVGSGAGLPVTGVYGDYFVQLVAAGAVAPSGLGAGVNLTGTVTRIANSGQPPLQGLITSFDFGRFGPLPGGAGFLTLTGAGTGTTFTQLSGAVGYGPPGAVAFQSIGNTVVEGFTYGGGAFADVSGPHAVDPGAVALNLFTQFIPNQIGDSISIPVDAAAGDPITPGEDPVLVGEKGCRHYRLDELLIQPPNPICPTEHFQANGGESATSLEGDAAPDDDVCGAGVFEEFRIRRATTLNGITSIDEPLVIPAGTTLVIGDGGQVTIEPDASISVDSDASIVVRGELINLGGLFADADSLISIAGLGRIENAGSLENGGMLSVEGWLDNWGELVICEAGDLKGSGPVNGDPPIGSPICVPEPAIASAFFPGVLLLRGLRHRRQGWQRRGGESQGRLIA